MQPDFAVFRNRHRVQSGLVRRSASWPAAVLTVLLLAAPAVAATGRTRGRAPRRPAVVDLVWHVETLAGEAVTSNLQDAPINPASVVKVATSLWALERLGPDFRFETRVFARGEIDSARGVLKGDLVVRGAGDPDFQAESVFLVASALNQLGIKQVTGAVIVSRDFWIGWENGSAGVDPDPVKRGLLMATRLRQTLDPRRWNGVTRRTWREFALRRNLNLGYPPRVQVLGGVGVDGARTGELVLVHRSGPLASTLRRFNCFSNNDIERVGADLGPVEELSSLLRVRCDAPADAIQLETTSGLGTNRVTPRLVVRLLREFVATCTRVGLSIESVLPVVGCDPGTVERFFPRLQETPYTASVVGKTGTLTSTDGGVAVLAGIARTASGDVAFCVAAPNARGKLHLARKTEEQWVLDLIARYGGPQPRTCAPPLGAPDGEAAIIAVRASTASSSSAAGR